jgi:hypothetical protein
MTVRSNSWIWSLAVIALVLFKPAAAEEVWFAPPDNLPRFGQVAMADYPRLFDPDAKWELAASRINVFSLDPFYVLRSSEAELRNVLNFLSSRNIALNVALQALPAENCGHDVEGIVSIVKESLSVAQRLKKLSANVASFSFDEPLEYGHIYNHRAACRYSVQEVAMRLAQTVQGVHAIYPNAKFVDYEVPLDLPPAEWASTLREWLTAYRAASGLALDGLAMDIDFRKPWLSSTRQSIQILHTHGVKAGLFLNAAGGPDVTDESWMAKARQNIVDVQREKIPLDFVIIATWMKHPSRALPETDPLALTSLVNWYFEHRAVSR